MLVQCAHAGLVHELSFATLSTTIGSTLVAGNFAYIEALY